MKVTWKSHVVFCAAGLTILALCNDNPQNHQVPRLSVRVIDSSEVLLRDTLHIQVETEGGDGRAISYCWSREGSWAIDTVNTPSYAAVWQFPDTGVQRMVVRAFDSTGRFSDADTISVHVRYAKPDAALAGDTIAFVNDLALFLVQGSDSDGTIERYEWSADNQGLRVTDASEDSLKLQWGSDDTGYHTVRVVAVDNDGFRSDPASRSIRITRSSPRLTLSGDSLVSINDTLKVDCRADDDDGTIKEYQWSVDTDSLAWLTTLSGSRSFTWRMPDSGKHVIRARVVDNDGLISSPESLLIFVSAWPPVINLDGAHQALAGDSITFTARGEDADGLIARYQWQQGADGGGKTMTTLDSTITVTWSERDTGVQTITVVAIDNDSLMSIPAEITVIINPGHVLKSFNDTTLTSFDTLLMTRSLVDTTLEAVMYYWNWDGASAWNDSTADPQHLFVYNGSSPMRVIVGVRDGVDNFFQDTVLVYFNRPPQIDTLSLTDGDTVWMPENGVPGTLAFRYRVSDPDNDSLTCFFTWGRVEIDTFNCTTTTSLPLDSLGGYQWQFSVSDRSSGQQTVRSGTTFIGREHTVCFAGHSIIAGTLGDNIGGGFRSGVLAGLRDSLGVLERVRTVGPFVTGLMAGNPRDDSCFAIPGSYAREMLLLMDHAYTNLTADIWVLMLGVNNGFSDIEMKATTAMMSRMVTRNPQAHVYVITAPPLPSTFDAKINNVQRPWYNRNIRDTVSHAASNGFTVYIVAGDTVLSNGSNGFNDTLFSDPVHPNQLGYDRLRNEILRVMWSNVPPVFIPGKEE